MIPPVLSGFKRRDYVNLVHPNESSQDTALSVLSIVLSGHYADSGGIDRDFFKLTYFHFDQHPLRTIRAERLLHCYPASPAVEASSVTRPNTVIHFGVRFRKPGEKFSASCKMWML